MEREEKMSRQDDEKFRQKYQSSKEYEKEMQERLKKQAKAAQMRANILRETAKRHEQTAEKHEEIAKESLEIAKNERNLAKNYISEAEKEECLEDDFLTSPAAFAKAVIPLIKRRLRSYIEIGKFVFEFSKEDIQLPQKTFLWQDTIVIRYQEDGQPIKKAYLSYNPTWRTLRAAKKAKNQYLQMSYIFELGEETKFESLTEGIEHLEKYVTSI